MHAKQKWAKNLSNRPSEDSFTYILQKALSKSVWHKRSQAMLKFEGPKKGSQTALM